MKSHFLFNTLCVCVGWGGVGGATSLKFVMCQNHCHSKVCDFILNELKTRCA